MATTSRSSPGLTAVGDDAGSSPGIGRHHHCVAGCVRRPVQRSIVADSWELLTGLVRKSFMNDEQAPLALRIEAARILLLAAQRA